MNTQKKTLPLFAAYPKLEPVFPHISFCSFPTPVKHYPAIHNNLWIKHDDKSGLLYGGNKTRKLEFILAQAMQRNKTHVITFGGTGTNHGLATAIHCKKLGLKCTVLLFDQEDSLIAQKNFQGMKSAGANLIHCGSLASTAFSFYVTQRLLHPSAYFLFAGGSNEEGCLAFINAAFELKQQLTSSNEPYPDVIFCSVGSTGTLAGLTLGCHLADLPIKVIGVRVAESHLGPIPTCTESNVTALMKNTLKKIRSADSDIAAALPLVNLINGYFGEGYGVATTEGENAETVFSESGILLEQTYTAKAAAAALDYCTQHPDQRVLYWHTFNSLEIK